MLRGFTLITLVYLIITIGILWGWVLNVMALVNSEMVPLTVLLILRFVGVIVAPLGALLGFMF